MGKNKMTRMLFALAAALLSTCLYADEEIYLYASYHADQNARVSHRMRCENSECVIRHNGTDTRTFSLNETQKEQILAAFQSELNRMEITSVPETDEQRVKIKFRYSTGSTRVEIAQRLPAQDLCEVSPKLTAVLETYFEGLDLSALRAPKPDASEKAADAPGEQQ